MKIKSFFLLFLFLSICNSKAFSQVVSSKAYIKEEADEFFTKGRYWDAFFLYRSLAKIPEFQGNFEVENQIKNSSRAMFLWKKTEDYRALRKFDIAKDHLKEVIELNPNDPNRGLLPRLTLEQASEIQRFAFRQQTKEGTAESLNRAIKLYHLAIEEGLRDEMVFSLIKQCEHSLKNNVYPLIKQPTSYGINYEKEQERERQRSVEIIKDKNNL